MGVNITHKLMTFKFPFSPWTSLSGLLCIIFPLKLLIASACNVGDLGLIPGSGRSPGEEMATYSSILAWRIPCTEEPQIRSVSQSCLTLGNPMDSSFPGSSVHAILQARILEWVVISSPGDLPDVGIELRSPAFQADSLPSEPPEKPSQPSWSGFNAHTVCI